MTSAESCLEATKYPACNSALHPSTGNCSITVATSIAPKNIESQQVSVSSWTKLGFQVLSVNSKEEINLLKDQFPEVIFVVAERTAQELLGKPLIFFDDVLKALDAAASKICGIINSDIILRADKGFLEFIEKEARNCLVYGKRVNIESPQHDSGTHYESGFDFFFFDRKVIGLFPTTVFSIGAPWWDYWMVALPSFLSYQVKQLEAPVAFHVIHPTNWSDEHWKFLGNYFSSYLSSLNIIFSIEDLDTASAVFLTSLQIHTPKIKYYPSKPLAEEPQKRSSQKKALDDPRPIVSAIVSTYNSEVFMLGCLEDLIGQSLFEMGQLEIIVIDSASPQNERAIVKRFQERYGDRIIYIRTDTRETIYQAWNRGVAIARGIYLTNANTDDRHRRDALEVMAKTLDDNSDIALVYADSHITIKENITFDQTLPELSYLWPEFDPRLLFQCCYIGPQPMWRRSLHRNHGQFDPSFQSAGDYEFWLRLVSAGEQFLHIQDFLGLYLYSESGVEAGNHELSNKEAKEARARHWPSLNGNIPPNVGNFFVTWPQISVVTPLLNQSRSIEKTIKSVLIQHYPNMEHIVIDSGSSDGTLEILRQYEHLIWISEPNGVQSNAINKGLSKASGEIIAWINSGDWYEPDTFRKIAEFFLRNPDKNVVMGDCNLTDEDGNVIDRIINHKREKTEIERHWLQQSIPMPPAVFFRKKLLDEHGYLNETLHYAMVFDLWMRFSADNTFHHINLPVANHRSHESAKGGGGCQEKLISECDLVYKRYSTPIVSVVIPSYNYATYLPQAVKSIANQTFRGFEIIIVEDGSTDNSLEVAERLVADFPQLCITIIKQKNAGGASSRNNGIKQARGRYILPLDADDFIDPTFIEKAVTVLEADPSYGLVYSHIKHEGTRSDIWPSGEFSVELLAQDNIIPYCALYRKALWEAVGGYRTDIVGYADWHLWLDFCEQGARGKLLPEALFHYRKHERGRLKDLTDQRLRLLEEIVSKHPKIYINHDKPKGYANVSKPSRILIMVSHFWPSTGGIETIAENLGVQLIGKGHQVSVATFRRPERSSTNYRGMKIFHLEEGISGQFDACIVLADPLNPLIWMATRAINSRSTRLIIQPIINHDGYERWRRKIPFRKRLADVLKSATAVVSLTQTGVDAAFLKEAGVPFHYIPNAVESRSADYNFRSRYNVPEAASLILHIANLWPVKNHLGLIDTLRKMHGDWWRLVIIGYPSVYTDYGAKVLNAVGEDDRIILIPGLLAHEVAAAQEAADLIVLASLGEVAPVCILEAMCLGKPWVATSECGAVNEFAGGIVTPLEEFPFLISFLFAHQVYLDKLGSLGHQNWESVFRWEVVIGAWDSLVREGQWNGAISMPSEIDSGMKAVMASIINEVENESGTGQPLVSVVVPTFNRPELLAQTLQSILDQTYRNFEILVVNDAGVDVGELIDHLNQEDKIRYFNLPFKVERSASRNIALKEARGKYIAYLDDDDCYHPNHLETLVKALKNTECKVAYTDAERVNLSAYSSSRSDAPDVPYSYDFDPIRLAIENYIPILCLMHERSLLDTVGFFDETLSRLEDWDLWIRLASASAFYHIPKVTCQFTMHLSGSTMASSNAPRFLECYKNICSKYQHLRSLSPDITVWQLRNVFHKTCFVYEHIMKSLTASPDDVSVSESSQRPIIKALLAEGVRQIQIESALAWIRGRNSGDTQAERWLSKAIAGDPENYPARMELVNLLLKQGRQVEALSHVRLLSDASPGDEEISRLLTQLGDGRTSNMHNGGL